MQPLHQGTTVCVLGPMGVRAREQLGWFSPQSLIVYDDFGCDTHTVTVMWRDPHMVTVISQPFRTWGGLPEPAQPPGHIPWGLDVPVQYSSLL